MDRGFLLGDGVYEMFVAYNGKLFQVEQHLQRLTNSLAAIHLDPGISHEDWIKLLETLIAKNGGAHQSVYLQITRGYAPERTLTFPEETTPTKYLRLPVFAK